MTGRTGRDRTNRNGPVSPATSCQSCHVVPSGRPPNENEPMSDYAFVTKWELDAPVGAVWDEIARPLAWPTWWRGVERVVELTPGDADGLGSLLRFTWRSVLPYRLTFDMRT